MEIVRLPLTLWIKETVPVDEGRANGAEKTISVAPKLNDGTIESALSRVMMRS